MFENPFTPFGGKPKRFFGRGDILKRFDTALASYGSAERALFVTGTHGIGKTALIEQLSLRARRAGMLPIDLGVKDTVHLLMRSLQACDEESRRADSKTGASTLGMGGSVEGVSSTKVTHLERADLLFVFLRACENHPRGIFVSIDEVQKVPEADLSLIGGAFQMASRKGHNTLIALAGLPYAHEQTIHYEGCTYLCRMAHEELGLFSWEEAYDALMEPLSSIGGLSIGKEALEQLVRASYGHPSVIQLLGYHVVAYLNARGERSPYVVTSNDAASAIQLAVASYERCALAPLLDECSTQERRFLFGMSEVLGEDRVAHVSEVAVALDTQPCQLSAAREALIKTGIIIPAGRDELMFNIPYLAAYVRKGPGETVNRMRVRSWDLST